MVYSSAEHYPLAQSLRSFIIDNVAFGQLRVIAEELGRLSVRIVPSDCRSARELKGWLKKLSKIMSPLVNLTHLETCLGSCLEAYSATTRCQRSIRLSQNGICSMIISKRTVCSLVPGWCAKSRGSSGTVTVTFSFHEKNKFQCN